MLVRIRPDGGIVEFNLAAHSLPLDTADADVIGGGWSRLVPNQVERLRLNDFLTRGEAGAVELTAGESGIIRAHVLAGEGERIVRLDDVTDLVTNVAQLTDRCAQLQSLLNLSRQDRQLIAFEIHDGLVQEMTAAQLFLEAATSAIGDDSNLPAEAMASLRDASKFLKRSIDGARDIIDGLYPVELQEAGLVEGLARLIDGGPAIAAGIHVHFSSSDSFADLDPTLALSIYRIVQESLNNAWKHSGATEVSIDMQRQAGEITITVEDNGKGFNVSSQGSQRFGLKGVRHRAVTFGGRCKIDSQPGEGTRVIVSLPLIQHF
ncbi:MAG: sensor histidine kinase [Planctomycetales bacterium]|nr:sensor histidine kinase [Planctomycetales bacterium]